MEQWSILSNTLNYIQYDRHLKNYHSLGISAMDKCGKNPCTKEERDILELDFGPTPDILWKEYLDMYEGIQSEIVNTTTFDEKSDLSSTYMGKSDRSKNSKIKAEESFPISEQGYTLRKLLDRCSANHSTLYPSLHQKQRIQVGNGQFVSVLFIIPVKVHIHGHNLKYTP